MSTRSGAWAGATLQSQRALRNRSVVATRRLIGASIPRSGHHLLVRLLESALGEAFAFCEFYTPRACCAQVPCVRATAARVLLQKNHDFDLRLPDDVAAALYVVQYRNAVDEALSDRELVGEVHGEARAADRDDYLVWLGGKLAYLGGFHRKWLATRRATAAYVAYEDLIADPGAALRAVCALVGESLDGAAVAAAVAAAMPFGGERGERAYVRRPLGERRFAHWDLLARYESWLARHAPALVGERRAADTHDPVHPLIEIQRAAAARLAGSSGDAIAPLDRALAQLPDNPYLHLMLGTVLCELERWEDAIPPLEFAARARPDEEQVLVQLSLAQWRTGSPAAGCETAERLVVLCPGRDDYQVHLAGLAFAAGEDGRARGVLAEVLAAAAPTAPALLWAADLLAAKQMRREALAAAERALAVAPERPDVQARVVAARQALDQPR